MHHKFEFATLSSTPTTITSHHSLQSEWCYAIATTSSSPSLRNNSASHWTISDMQFAGPYSSSLGTFLFISFTNSVQCLSDRDDVTVATTMTECLKSEASLAQTRHTLGLGLMVRRQKLLTGYQTSSTAPTGHSVNRLKNIAIFPFSHRTGFFVH